MVYTTNTIRSAADIGLLSTLGDKDGDLHFDEWLRSMKAAVVRELAEKLRTKNVIFVNNSSYPMTDREFYIAWLSAEAERLERE